MYLHRTVLFLNVSHWKQDHHFMWSPEPACEGLRAIYLQGKGSTSLLF